MGQAQHGRFCSCRDCEPLRKRQGPVRDIEPESAERLRASYESALDEMQRLCEAHPQADVFEPLRTFLTEAGRRVR